MHGARPDRLLTVLVDVALRRIALSGELDMAGAGELAKAVAGLDASPGDVTIDLSRLNFIDAAGLGAIVAVRNQLLTNGRRLRLARGTARVTRVFLLAGLAILLEPSPGRHPLATPDI